MKKNNTLFLVRLVSLFALLGSTTLTARAQYCTVSFSYPCNWNYAYINSFSTTGGSTNITSNNTGCGSSSTGYTYYNTRIHTGIQGQVVSFSLKNCPSYAMYYKIWVDFNCDGDFVDAGEEVYSNSNLTYGGTANGSFTIPVTATPGTSRLRIRANVSWHGSAPVPCGKMSYGECEDYGFVIVPACSTKFSKPIDPASFACENGPGSIEVHASNGAAYQWQMLTGTSFTDLADNTSFGGTQTSKLLLYNTPMSMKGRLFRCIVTPTCGSTIKNISDTVALNIKPNITIATQPVTDTSCVGYNTLLTYKTNGELDHTTWQLYDKVSGTFNNISGPPFFANNDSLHIYNIQDTLNGAKIRFIAHGICGMDTSSDILLAVNAIPNVVTHPKDLNLEQGETAVFQVVAAGAGVKYRWQVGYKDTFSNINDGGIYDGVHTNKLTIKAVSRAQNDFQFRCIVSGSGNCTKKDTSNFAMLYVQPPMSLESISDNNRINIFPNPAAGEQIVIKTKESTPGASYKILNKQGSVVVEGNIIQKERTEVNISKLPPDIYTLQISDINNLVIHTQKFTRL